MVDKSGQGRGIYYDRLKMGDTQWSNPIPLQEVESGLGTWNPAIIEYDDMVVAVYNIAPKLVVQRSNDSGQTWTTPIQPFEQHRGVNGVPALVVDSDKKLHIFFGQRIPGDSGQADTHGMWHSVWLNGDSWSPPEAVVSGPRVVDTVGYTGFDPYIARAAVSQGNVLLVSWRTDPGDIKANGVWYSYKQLNSPELAVVALPTSVPLPTPENTPIALSLESSATLTATPTNIPTPEVLEVNPQNETVDEISPARTLIVGLIPVVLLISAVVGVRAVYFRKHR
jgi:hypothetical protein